MTFATGIEFIEVYARRSQVDVDGVTVDVVSAADLKLNKLATGRLRDLADAQELPDVPD